MRAAVPLLLIGLLLTTVLALAACGKKGPPEAPGPPSEIIWPKSYPTR